jgi:hypothetical protein
MVASRSRAFMLLAGVVLAAGCAVQTPLSSRLQLRFDRDGRRVEITTDTELARDWEAGGAKERLDASRDAFLAGRDEWSNRYALIESESERSTQFKEQGLLRRVEHSAVADREQLTRFFSDTPLTFQLLSGDGWSEASIFTGSGSRATREQKDRVEHYLSLWSDDGARYLRAIDKLYEYLDRRPDRAEAAFAALLSDDEQPPSNDEEGALLNEAHAAIKQILDRADDARANASTLDEDFNDVFNPFPAAMIVQTPGAVIAVENFVRLGDDSVEIPPAGITDALHALDGRWASPDPLALGIRAMMANQEPASPHDLAALKRKRTTATPGEIRDAITKALQRAKVYRVRWRS